MKICIICNEYPEGPHGGIGTVTQLLAREFTDMSHSVKVIGVYDHHYPAPVYEIKDHIEIHRIKVNYQSKIALMFGFFLLSNQVRHWIRKEQVDIIECPDSYGIFSLFAYFSKPLVLRSHGNNTYFSSILGLKIKKQTLFYERNLYRKSLKNIAVSEFTAKQTQALMRLPHPFKIIYNGISLPDLSSLNISDDDMSGLLNLPNPVIFSGTLIKKKGIYEAIQAILNLLVSGIKINLMINGKDTINPETGCSVSQELKSMIPAEYMEYFHFNGHITRVQLQYHYTNAKAALFPSYAEAFAMAPMESMACGTPTIFSRTCSGHELIDDKVDGLLIDPESPQEIADAILIILKNPEKAASMGKKGQEKIRTRFTKEVMAKQSIEFYEEVCASYHK